MSRDEKCGCNEYNSISRRNFVGLGSAAFATALSPSWLPRVVLASADNSARDVIVSIFLRGGIDGLTACVPFNERPYYDLRPNIAVAPPDSGDPNRAIALDDNFGLPPSMAPLTTPFNDKDLLVVHATGLENPTRSHFEAMRFMEVGQGNAPATLFTGWLGRHLAATAPSKASAVLRAVGMGYGLQRHLVGGPRALPIQDLSTFGFDGDFHTVNGRQKAIEAMYAAFPDPLSTAARNTTQTIDLLASIDFDGYRPTGGANYPEDEFGYAMRSTAALIKADIGVEAVSIDLGGWDTHDNQGSVDGWMSSLMGTFAMGMNALHRDLSKRKNVIVVAMSEFGRNAFENGSAGTDHGHASVMFVMGKNVAGGRVMTDWPGLEPEQLFEDQDLAITTDYRDILTEILTKRAGNPDFSTIFPEVGYTPTEHGVIV